MLMDIYGDEVEVNTHQHSMSLRRIIVLVLVTKGAFFWEYSGIGTPGIDGICVLLGAIPFSE